jgi:hypothetical protein
MKYEIICDANSCTIKKRAGIWPFYYLQPIDNSFSIYGHKFEMTWPDIESAQEYIAQTLCSHDV